MAKTIQELEVENFVLKQGLREVVKENVNLQRQLMDATTDKVTNEHKMKVLELIISEISEILEVEKEKL
jgi:hypothetical protein